MNKNMPSDPIPEQLRRAIKKYGHTQKEVGEFLGIAQSSVSNILHGKMLELADSCMSKIRKYIMYGKTKVDTPEVRLPAFMEKKPSRYTKHAVTFTLKKTIKDIHGQPIGCIMSKVWDNLGLVSIGVSMCNTKHDKYNKQIAEVIALKRADNYTTTYAFKNKETYDSSVADEIGCFTIRCMNYYKNKGIILPKITYFEW